jgi:hypothetical protein
MAAASSQQALQDLPDMDVRALTECMTVLPHAPEMYEVVSGSGASYIVDARGGSCTCPDARYRDRTCKHQRRVAYERGKESLPAWVNRAALDEFFQAFVTPEGGGER